MNLIRFIESYNTTQAILPIHVIFDANDAHNYNDVETPPHWKRITVPTGYRLGDIFNLIFKHFPNEPYYGMVADDVVPTSLRWDTILAVACQPDKIAWGFDGIQNKNLPVHPFIGGDLIRKLGWWAAPGVKHWFVDNAWKSLTVALQNAVYLPDVTMPHHHYITGHAPIDNTYRNQPDHNADQMAYMNFMNTEFPLAVSRAK